MEEKMALFETSKISWNEYAKDSDSDNTREEANVVVVSGCSNGGPLVSEQEEVPHDVEIQSPRNPHTAVKVSGKYNGKGEGKGNKNRKGKVNVNGTENEKERAQAKGPEVSDEKRDPVGVT
jgi:hypothetical protein